MTDRADEIVTSEDFPFETTECPECGVRHSDIPALMKAAEQIRAYGDERVKAALEDERELLFSPMTTGGRAIRAPKKEKP